MKLRTLLFANVFAALLLVALFDPGNVRTDHGRFVRRLAINGCRGISGCQPNSRAIGSVDVYNRLSRRGPVSVDP